MTERWGQTSFKLHPLLFTETFLHTPRAMAGSTRVPQATVFHLITPFNTRGFLHFPPDRFAEHILHRKHDPREFSEDIVAPLRTAVYYWPRILRHRLPMVNISLSTPLNFPDDPSSRFLDLVAAL